MCIRDRHGGFHSADAHRHLVALYLDDRHVLFQCPVRSAGDDLLHRIAAAHNGHAAAAHISDDISTMFTAVSYTHLDVYKRQELDLVLELDGRVIGSILYTKAKLSDAAGKEKEILTFGPCLLYTSRCV